jgi:hypothetical protein
VLAIADEVIEHGFCCAAFGRDWHKADLARRLPVCPLL